MEKYVFCDLDDSLIVNGKLNEQIMYLYNNLQEATWVLNTGRSYSMACEILSYLNFPNIDIIGLNGNQLVTKDGIQYLKVLEKKVITQLINFYEGSQSIINFYSSKNDYYLSFKDNIELCIHYARKANLKENEILIKAIQYYMLYFEHFLKYTGKEDFDMFKITVTGNEQNLIRDFEELELGNYCEATFLSNSIELSPIGINKGTGIRKYFELYNKKQEDYIIIAIGDAENDISMFEQADIKIGSQKCTESIKKRSNFITDESQMTDILRKIELYKKL
ncbi:HAD family phosphatase [Vagococcus fluvialis]|uniref:HAD-IIB family hydrolase n=1 Tax=Vagococcus fluvialis TaxID=2738 RepID=UPI001A8E922B|nr:HAD family hydrolase [Vagococcus fluvialis]MBO0444260.1 HAD family phosphatase [Vagococcus fluvialis]